MAGDLRARVSMWSDCPAERAFDAFVQPAALTQFWLSAAQAPLEIGRAVHWSFLVEGGEIDTTARRIDRPSALEWDWSDGSHVAIDFEPVDGGTAVTLVNDRLPAGADGQVAAALNATEGFALVLADLKSWIDSGTSAGITRAKARLIARRG